MLVSIHALRTIELEGDEWYAGFRHFKERKVAERFLHPEPNPVPDHPQDIICCFYSKLLNKKAINCQAKKR